MTEADAIAQLKALEKTCDMDTEEEHLAADRILCEFLRSNGYGGLASQFEEQAANYWYA